MAKGVYRRRSFQRAPRRFFYSGVAGGASYDNSVSLARASGVALGGVFTGVGSVSLGRSLGASENGIIAAAGSVGLGRALGVADTSALSGAASLSLARVLGVTQSSALNIGPTLSLGRALSLSALSYGVFYNAVTLGVGLGTTDGSSVSSGSSLLTSIEAYWKLDESSDGSTATTRNDSVGTRNLTDVNTTASAAGKIDNGADFELSNNEALYITDNATLSVTDEDFSFSMWVKLESGSATRYLLGKGYSTASHAFFQYRLYVNSSNQVVWDVSSGSSGSNLASTATLSTGTWAFIVVYHDSVNNEVGISIDGGAYKTAAWSGGCYDDIGNFTLGTFPQSNPPTAGSMDGVIDEVGFWKRKITIDEVGTLYNGGAGLTYPFTGASGSLSIARYHGIAASSSIVAANTVALNKALAVSGGSLLSGVGSLSLARQVGLSSAAQLTAGGSLPLARVEGVVPATGLVGVASLGLGRVLAFSPIGGLTIEANVAVARYLAAVLSGEITLPPTIYIDWTLNGRSVDWTLKERSVDWILLARSLEWTLKGRSDEQ